jgi:hypothetical protein
LSILSPPGFEVFYDSKKDLNKITVRGGKYGGPYHIPIYFTDRRKNSIIWTGSGTGVLEPNCLHRDIILGRRD